MCYCPTPSLHLNLALTGDGAFLFSLKKTLSVWFKSILNYGDTENVLINHLLLVIPVSYPCHYTGYWDTRPETCWVIRASESATRSPSWWSFNQVIPWWRIKPSQLWIRLCSLLPGSAACNCVIMNTADCHLHSVRTRSKLNTRQMLVKTGCGCYSPAGWELYLERQFHIISKQWNICRDPEVL